MNFSSKGVLVTGASRGIGKVIAQQFAGEGANVAVHYHQNEAAANSTLASLAGGPHCLLQADLKQPDDVERLVEKAIAELGRIDILVNNAGIYDYHRIAEISYDAWQDQWLSTIQTNLLGAANVTYCTVRHMLENGGGKIINITSRGAFRGEPDAPAYGASKAGLNAMSQSLAKALAPKNIFVYAIAPGWVATDMAQPFLAGPEGDAIRKQSPLNRAAQPEEIAKTTLFLASDGTDYLTGCIIDANGASYLRS